MTEGGDGAVRRLRERVQLAWSRHTVARWPFVFGVVGGLALALGAASRLAGFVDLMPWWAWTGASALAIGLIPVYWLNRFEPNRNKQGQFAPRLQRQWLAVGLAILFAVAFEWVLFGLLAGEWTWPWEQVHELNGTSDSLVQPALALLTPVIALVTAVFAYRKSTIALAESQRADVAAFQQRFIDAAKLMADPNASTRIAGATAMGSLARDWVDNRQECVNVLCGYLKVKPSPEHLDIAGEGAEATYTWKAGEDEVRLEVVDQLRAVFTPGEGVPESPRRIDLKLSGGWFPPNARFSGATFDGVSWFDGATFTGRVRFDGATFTRRASFYKALLGAESLFDQACFANEVSFHGAVFSDSATFNAANFTGLAVFDRARFWGDAEYDGATFGDQVWFKRTTFVLDASFSGSTFAEIAGFRGADFTGRADFAEATFSQRYGAEAESLRRFPLGPLAPESSLPCPPGNVVEEDCTVVGEATWTRLRPEL